MSRFHLSRLREAATRGDVDDERQVTIKRTRIARQMISPWTSRAPLKIRDEEGGARNRGKRVRREQEDWLYA